MRFTEFYKKSINLWWRLDNTNEWEQLLYQMSETKFNHVENVKCGWKRKIRWCFTVTSYIVASLYRLHMLQIYIGSLYRFKLTFKTSTVSVFKLTFPTEANKNRLFRNIFIPHFYMFMCIYIMQIYILHREICLGWYAPGKILRWYVSTGSDICKL